MSQLQSLKREVLAGGVIGEAEVEAIRRTIFSAAKINKVDVDFLVEVRQEASSVCPAFEKLFFQAIKDHVLKNGIIDAEEAHWLRKMLFPNGKIDDRARDFLRDLKREARRISPEFQIFYGECMN